MTVLVVYCLKNVVTDWENRGISEIVSVFAVAASYRWKHNTLLPIVLGTVCNMVLLHIGCL